MHSGPRKETGKTTVILTFKPSLMESPTSAAWHLSMPTEWLKKARSTSGSHSGLGQEGRFRSRGPGARSRSKEKEYRARSREEGARSKS